MPTNDFKVFAGAAGSNVISQALYVVQSWLATGWTSGILPSAWINKPIRQASIISSMIAQFICDVTGGNAVDDGTIGTLESQFIAALYGLGRTYLTSTLNLFVNAGTGNDGNNGLSPSTAFATLQHAYDVASTKYDIAGHSIIVSIADGTYDAVIAQVPPLGAFGGPAAVTLGNTANPGNVIVSSITQNCFTANNGASFTLSGMTLTTPGGSGCGVLANQNGTVNIAASVVFGPCAAAHLLSENGSVIFINADYTIAGNAINHWNVTAGSSITAVGRTVSVIGTPAFSGAFAGANLGGILGVIGLTFSGAGGVTGQRYLASSNAVINTNGGGASYLPGNVAGAVATGGLYI